MKKIRKDIEKLKPRGYNYEQVLFQAKINQLFKSRYTDTEIRNFTGWNWATIQERRKEYNQKLLT